MKVLLVSPYNGGSHRAWAEGYQSHSQLDIDLLTLPGRFWKWRMHGGAVTLARRFLASSADPDVLICTDMLDLTTFYSLTRPRTAETPALLYLHENQLTYPLPRDPSRGAMRRQKGERDLHYAFINYVSMLAANQIVFNSEYHRREMLAALPSFLRHFPEKRELEEVSRLESKSAVLPVGIDLNRLRRAKRESEARMSPLILWNQRWEYDKNPAELLSVLLELADQGFEFEVAICGEAFQRQPDEFRPAIAALGERVVHVGYANMDHYHKLLWSADLTVSTADHEFFGISILEAVLCETFPVLPRRLSYPEIIPSAYHPDCLYGTREELVRRIRWVLGNLGHAREVASRLSRELEHYAWPVIAREYDRIICHMADSCPNHD